MSFLPVFCRTLLASIDSKATRCFASLVGANQDIIKKKLNEGLKPEGRKFFIKSLKNLAAVFCEKDVLDNLVSQVAGSWNRSVRTYHSSSPIQFQRKFSTSTSHSSSPDSPSKPRRATVIGGGSWGTAICKVIASNVVKYPDLFDQEVVLYLRDDNLRLVIEKTHVNIRYLLQIKLPSNIRPVSNLDEAISRSDILIFAIPHEYIKDVCYHISQNSLPTLKPVGISLIKGLHIDSSGNLERSSQIIRRMLGIDCGVLSGANVALDVAKEEFSEATLSPPEPCNAKLDNLLLSLFQTHYFRIAICYDTPTVEICGALKNVISCGAGIVDGLGFGVNTKAAAIRAGIREAIRFVEIFEPGFQLSTFFENCGIADIIASSFGGRNRKVIEEFVNSNKSLAVLEREILMGQKLQGPNTAAVVHRLLKNKNITNQFPLFTTIHRICSREAEPNSIIKALERNP